MKYVASPFFKWAKKDYLDQPAHFAVGFFNIGTLTYFVSNSIVIGMGCFIILAIMAKRESDQHQESKVIFDLDLLFVFVGCLCGIFIGAWLK